MKFALGLMKRLGNNETTAVFVGTFLCLSSKSFVIVTVHDVLREAVLIVEK